MKLSVHLVTWNGEKYIPYLFDSLKKQTFRDWRLVILDNGSSDNTVGRIEEECRMWNVECGDCVEIEFIKGKENLGFAGGHNKLFEKTENREQRTSDYILLLNQDMVLEEDCLEKLVNFMEENNDAAATVSPRLMRWNHEFLITNPHESIEKSFTNKIDSLGLKVYRNRRVIEQYTGKEWSEAQRSLITDHRSLEVFGVSGALPMYRSDALKQVAFSDGTIFDSLYNSYKEDVDLAFRLRSAGYKAFVLTDAVAYHDRSAEGLQDKSDKAAVKNKKKQSEWVRYHSYKNHLMTIYKNEYWQNLLLDFIFIKWYECKKFFWFLLFDRKVLKGLGEIWKNRKELKKKKIEIKNKRKVSWREIRKWLKS